MVSGVGGLQAQAESSYSTAAFKVFETWPFLHGSHVHLVVRQRAGPDGLCGASSHPKTQGH